MQPEWRSRTFSDYEPELHGRHLACHEQVARAYQKLPASSVQPCSKMRKKSSKTKSSLPTMERMTRMPTPARDRGDHDGDGDGGGGAQAASEWTGTNLMLVVGLAPPS